MKNLKDIKIGVVAGGVSSEKDISLLSGKSVFEALKRKGLNAFLLEVGKDVKNDILRKDIDLAFLALHGRKGEDGSIQQFLQCQDILYTGSGPLSSNVCMDKEMTKKILKDNDLPIAKYMIVNKKQYFNLDSYDMGFPVVVKPSKEGSSFGLSVVKDKGDLIPAMKEAFEYGSTILVESFIKGKEITVGILGKQALPVLEIIAKDNIYDYHAKYDDENTQYICPAQISQELTIRAQKVAMDAHMVLGCKDFSRVDMRVDDQGNIYILEVNTIPGLTHRSLLPKAARVFGIGFDDLCVSIVELALFRTVRYGEEDKLG